MNWSTVTGNISSNKESQKMKMKLLESFNSEVSFEEIIPISFESTRWMFFKGKRKVMINDMIGGIGIDITSFLEKAGKHGISLSSLFKNDKNEELYDFQVIPSIETFIVIIEVQIGMLFNNIVQENSEMENERNLLHFLQKTIEKIKNLLLEK